MNRMPHCSQTGLAIGSPVQELKSPASDSSGRNPQNAIHCAREKLHCLNTFRHMDGDALAGEWCRHHRYRSLRLGH